MNWLLPYNNAVGRFVNTPEQENWLVAYVCVLNGWSSKSTRLDIISYGATEEDALYFAASYFKKQGIADFTSMYELATRCTVYKVWDDFASECAEYVLTA